MARLNLGRQAVIKFKESPGEPDDFAPLLAMQCEKCHLIQLSHTVERDRVFRSSYGYKSGMNKTMKNALKDVVETACRYVKLDWKDLVIDIGSNDSTLLDCYPKFVQTVGFEPSSIEGSGPNHHFIIHDYFIWEKAHLIVDARGKKPKIITAIAMFYSVEDPNQFLADVKKILAPDGVFILQVNYLGFLIDNLIIGDIVHEHVCYYSFESLYPILERNELSIFNYEWNDVNGGSLRVIIGHKESGRYIYPGDEFHRESRFSKDETWKDFSARLSKAKEEIVRCLDKFKEKKVWAYGASTRGNTVLQYLDIKPEKIVDKNPEKFGKYMAGSNALIISEEEMRQDPPDYLLIMNPSFIDEFAARESKFLEDGGRFLSLLPKPVVFSKDGTESLV